MNITSHAPVTIPESLSPAVTLGSITMALVCFIAVLFLLSMTLISLTEGERLRALIPGALGLAAFGLMAWAFNFSTDAIGQNHAEQAQAHQQQADQIAQQREQIDDVYDLEGITLQSPPDELLCVDGAEQTRTLEAAWSGGYGRAVVGPEQNGACTFDLFDETGRRIEPRA